MKASLRDLLRRGIDYSGMFPPAKLSAEEAVGEYRALQSSDLNWMLHRFSAPISALAHPAVLSLGEEPVAVIGRRGGDWENNRAEDAHDLNAFLHAGGKVGSYECELPDTDDVEEVLGQLRGFSAADEVMVELNPDRPFPMILDALADADAFGAKLRTGPTPPPSEIVATFIWECVALELPFKLTAGLHDPLTGNGRLGFVNVLASTAAAIQHDLSVSEIRTILDSADPTEWRFEDRQIFFQDWDVSRDAIEDARALFASFGSCSVEEPAEGLSKLGWMV